MRTLATKQLVDEVASIESCLRAAGAHLWSRQAIDTYMKGEAAKLKPNIWWYIDQAVGFFTGSTHRDRLAHWLLDPIGMGLLALITMACAAFAVSFAVCFVAPFAWMAGIMTVSSAWTLEGQGLVMMLESLGTLFAAALSAFAMGIAEIEIVSPGRWETFRTDAPDTPTVRRIMDGIRAFFPSATFEVSYLYQDKHLLDPVLWATLDALKPDERYAVLVWKDQDVVVLPPRA